MSIGAGIARKLGVLPLPNLPYRACKSSKQLKAVSFFSATNVFVNKSFKSNLAFEFIDAFLVSYFLIFNFFPEKSFVPFNLIDFELRLSHLSDLVAKFSTLVRESISRDECFTFSWYHLKWTITRSMSVNILLLVTLSRFPIVGSGAGVLSNVCKRDASSLYILLLNVSVSKSW